MNYVFDPKRVPVQYHRELKLLINLMKPIAHRLNEISQEIPKEQPLSNFQIDYGAFGVQIINKPPIGQPPSFN